MFDANAYEKLMKSREFRGFARNCYLGFLGSYLIVLLILTGIMGIVYSGKGCDLTSCIAVMIPGYLLGALMVALIISLSLYKIQPALCAYGTIVSKDKKHAVVRVEDREIRGSSFERFLRNVTLDEYSTGDEVIIYSSKRKHGRPLFFRAG